eukprot:gene26303-biopygen3032
MDAAGLWSVLCLVLSGLTSWCCLAGDVAEKPGRFLSPASDVGRDSGAARIVELLEPTLEHVWTKYLPQFPFETAEEI